MATLHILYVCFFFINKKIFPTKYIHTHTQSKQKKNLKVWKTKENPKNWLGQQQQQQNDHRHHHHLCISNTSRFCYFSFETFYFVFFSFIHIFFLFLFWSQNLNNKVTAYCFFGHLFLFIFEQKLRISFFFHFQTTGHCGGPNNYSCPNIWIIYKFIHSGFSFQNLNVFDGFCDAVYWNDYSTT